MFWPAPDAVYELFYRYRKKPAVLATTQYAAGGTEHAETILASCFEIASGGKRDLHNRFMEKLKSSIDLDRMEQAPETLGYNGDGSGSFSIERTSGYVTYAGNTG